MQSLRVYVTILAPLFLATILLWQVPFGQSQGQNYFVIVVILVLALVAVLIIRRSRWVTSDDQSSAVLHERNKILQASLDGIITVNEQGKVIAFNPAAETIFGYRTEEVQNRCLTELIIPERLKQQHLTSLQRFINTGEKRIMGKRIEVPAVRSNGEEFPVEMTLTSIEQDGQTLITAFLRDLTEKKRAEAQAEIASTVFSKAAEGIMVTSSDNRVKAVNPAFLRITGYQEEEVLGQNPSMFGSGRHDSAFYQSLWSQLVDTGAWDGEVWDQRKNGEIYPAQLSIAVVKNSEGMITDHVAVLGDISQRKEVEAKIIHQATHDPLTGLPNRALFFDRLSQAIAGGRRSREGQSIAVLFVDLDNFKPINDRHGHLTGDRLLKKVATRLSLSIREVDTVARFGGDEFALVLPAIERPDFAQSLAEKLLEQVKKPYLINDKELIIGCSIGISLYPRDGESADQLISSADKAMYSAKSAGGNRSYSR